MTEISQLCTRIVAHEEDGKENRVTAQRKKQRLQESCSVPVSCLVGTMGSLSDKMARLPPLFWPGGRASQGPDRGPTLVPLLEDRDRQEKGVAKSSRVSQQDPSQSRRRSVIPTEKREEGVPRLVELYQCPGLRDDSPTPLPHDTAYSTVVAHVVRAQRHLAHKPRYRAVFQNILSSPVMEDFVSDSFWWLFMQNFQPAECLQDKLFTRIADNYIHILTQGFTSSTGNRFLRDFPSTLAQTLYCCFCCCFPHSRSALCSDGFLTALCFTAYQWTGGVCPAPDVYRKWNLEALELEEASDVDLVSGSDRTAKDGGGGSCLSLLDSMFSSAGVDGPFSSRSSLVQSGSYTRLRSQPSKQTVTSSPVKAEKAVGSDNITDLKALTGQGSQKPTRESHVAYPALEFKRGLFNVYGNSPLVQFYMLRHRKDHRVDQNVLVARTEIHKLPPAGSLTYRDVLTQAQERLDAHRSNLRSMWGQYAQDLSGLNQRKMDEHHQLIRKQKKILSKRATVRRLCQILVPDSNEEDTRSGPEVTRAFESAVSAVE